MNIVVALVDVYGERSLAWLLGVCNPDLPNSLLAFVEQSIFQVWQLYHAQFVSYVVFGVPTQRERGIDLLAIPFSGSTFLLLSSVNGMCSTAGMGI